MHQVFRPCWDSADIVTIPHAKALGYVSAGAIPSSSNMFDLGVAVPAGGTDHEWIFSDNVATSC
jgi:hypothetical protein